MSLKRFCFVLFLAAVAYVGFKMGAGSFSFPLRKAGKISAVAPDKEYPIDDLHLFTAVVYASNQAPWVERCLGSLFSQDYERYRVVFIDDASTDGTYEKAEKYIEENNQSARVILMRNERKLGMPGSLYRATGSCHDREIIVPIEAKDWLAQEGVFSRLNGVFQNPDVWIASADSILYPSYETKCGLGLTAFYAALFKQVTIQDLFVHGKPAFRKEAFLNPIQQMAGGRVRLLFEPLSFFNTASFSAEEKGLPIEEGRSGYSALEEFPWSRQGEQKADIIAFSFDRPLQLYSLLESIYLYVTGFDQISVIYRVSDERYARGYAEVEAAFPQVHFIRQSSHARKDFKPLLVEAAFSSAAEYVLFAVDDLVVKDVVDLQFCMDAMRRTGAYGFYLRLGQHINHCYMTGQPQPVPPSLHLGESLYAWDFRGGKEDWSYPESLDMTLYRKADLEQPIRDLRYKSPTTFQASWGQKLTNCPIGLYFEHSKVVHLPLNVVSASDFRHMNFLTAEELLVKFNEGLKIDIAPLFQIENPSPDFDYPPEFIAP